MSINKNILKSVAFIIGITFVFFCVVYLSGFLFVSSSKCSKNGIEIIKNPLYLKEFDGYLLWTQDREDSYFGRKGDKIYRVQETDLLGNVCIQIKHADALTFNVLSQNNAVDKNNAYFQASYMGKERKKNEYTIFNIDRQTYEILDSTGEYSRDKKNVYYRTEIFNGADPETFSLIKYQGRTIYTKDKNHIFNNANVFSDITGDYSEFTKTVDLSTFQLLDEKYAKDKNNVYGLKGEIIEGADSETFKLREKGYCYDYSGFEMLCPQLYDASDKNSKYKERKKINGEELNSPSSNMRFYKLDFVQALNMKDEKIFTKSTDTPGKASWINDGNYLKMETGSMHGGLNDNVLIYSEIEIPEDMEVMKFRYKFPFDEKTTESLMEVFFGSKRVFDDNSDSLSVPAKGDWRNSKWIDLYDFAGKKVRVYMRLSKLKDKESHQGILFIKDIVFAKRREINPFDETEKHGDGTESLFEIDSNLSFIFN